MRYGYSKPKKQGKMREHDPVVLKDDTRLIGARSRSSGYPVDYYDDGEGPLWLFGHEFGATMVIRARSFETAWEIAIDESATIPKEELYEAYVDDEGNGFDSQEAFDAYIAKVDIGECEHPDLAEGYEYQSSFTGTGVVNVGYYAWLREMTHADCKDDMHGIRPVVLHDDFEAERIKLEVSSYAYTYKLANAEPVTVQTYDLTHDIGRLLREKERELGPLSVETTWKRDSDDSAA